MTSQEELIYQMEITRKLQDRIKALATHVKNMRKAQNQYFRTKNNQALKRSALEAAKAFEAKTDAFVKQLEFEGLI